MATAADQAPAAQGSCQPSQSAAPKPERLTEQEKGIQYARCMTKHGVEVSDPVDGAMPNIKQNDGMVIIGGLTDTLPVIKLYRSWRRIERHDTMAQYARKALLRTYLDERRRPWRREFSTKPAGAELEVVGYEDDPTADRVAVRQAVMQLTKRHRAVLVLRFWGTCPWSRSRRSWIAPPAP